MKNLFLLLFFAALGASNLQAQTVNNIWEEMETYIVKHLDDPIPDEAKIMEIFRLNLLQEAEQVEGQKELVNLVRRNHWQKKFIADHPEEIAQAKEKEKGAAASPVNNPDLVDYCPLNIAVIVDRSGSIVGDEVTNIRAGLSALVNNMIGTGHTLTFIGMGDKTGLDANSGITSATVTYSPGGQFPHQFWINFALDFDAGNDSWSTGLVRAIPLNPDLVLIITDGNDGHDADEDLNTIAAANILKNNGANDGNGAHIFVFGEETPFDTGYEDYADPSLEIVFSEAIELFIAPGSVESPTPPTLQNIGTTDYVRFTDNQNFAQLANWLAGLQFSGGAIETTDILNEPCDADFGIRGNYELCGGTVSLITLEIIENGVTITTLNASFNNDTWSISIPHDDLENLGLEYGHSYDVIPHIIFTDGSVSSGSDFIPGPDNDFFFELVDCCEIDASIYYVPECVNLGEEFFIVVELDGNITLDDIDEIYTADNNYSYVSHFILNWGNGVSYLYITFTSNTCTCEGEMLTFDIRLTDCAEVIWLMTDKIPCCAEECKSVIIEDWYAEDCTIVNGDLARYFCIEVTSDDPITAVFPTTNTVTCQTSLVGLEIANIGGTNTYTICGFMVFDDPGCTTHAKVSLKIETTTGCCTIDQSFSFPGGCAIEKECIVPAANLEIIIGNGIDVSIDIPQGQVVTVFDPIANSINTYTVGLVHCGPFLYSNPGGVDPGNPDCNGIVLPTPAIADCFDEDIENPSINYHYEITWNDCVWTIIGNLCNEPIVTPAVPGFTGSTNSIDRNAKVQEEISSSDQIKVFPNPMDQSEFLNFDFGNLKTPVSTIEVRDVSGRIIDAFVPTQGQNKFQHQLQQPLSKGIYFLVFRLEDGQVSSTKLVSLD